MACPAYANYPGPMAEYATPEEEWHDFLSGTHPHLQDKSPLRFIPSNPRCKLCQAPFGRPGGLLLRRYGFAPWAKNPKICGRCFKGMQEHASMCPGDPDGSEVRGAEVELSMLFADVRGSSKLARQMSTLEFTQLMDRFYRASSEVLVDHDAIIEKFVGDEVVGLFLPFLAGPDHADASGRGRARALRGRGLRVGRGTVGAAGRRRPYGIGVRRDRRDAGRARFHRARRSDEHRGASRLAGRRGRDPRHPVGRRPHTSWSKPTWKRGTCR